MEAKRVDTIIDSYKSDPASILAMMQDIQDEARYVPRDAMERIAERIKVPVAQVYRLATFYDSIHLEPRGEHVCKVCTGTSCYTRGAEKVVEQLEHELAIKAGATTKDNRFTIEIVSCTGACACGPQAIIDEEYHNNMTADKMRQTIEQLKRGK